MLLKHVLGSLKKLWVQREGKVLTSVEAPNNTRKAVEVLRPWHPTNDLSPWCVLTLDHDEPAETPKRRPDQTTPC